MSELVFDAEHIIDMSPVAQYEVKIVKPKTIILSIPNHLSNTFLDLFESLLNNFLLDFGDDITETEQELIELLFAVIDENA